uniref:Uncharacterized protein n=1 Tax=Opuntia streptacantha TaxID=393608 RepID=A0A7C8YKU8_OPUST
MTHVFLSHPFPFHSMSLLHLGPCSIVTIADHANNTPKLNPSLHSSSILSFFLIPTSSWHQSITTSLNPTTPFYINRTQSRSIFPHFQPLLLLLPAFKSMLMILPIAMAVKRNMSKKDVPQSPNFESPLFLIFALLLPIPTSISPSLLHTIYLIKCPNHLSSYC